MTKLNIEDIHISSELKEGSYSKYGKSWYVSAGSKENPTSMRISNPKSPSEYLEVSFYQGYTGAGMVDGWDFDDSEHYHLDLKIKSKDKPENIIGETGYDIRGSFHDRPSDVLQEFINELKSTDSSFKTVASAVKYLRQKVRGEEAKIKEKELEKEKSAEKAASTVKQVFLQKLKKVIGR